MSVFTQRALSYARDSLKVYGDFRRKAKDMVAELKEQGITEVSFEGDDGDQALDILRLTCIEAGIRVVETPDGAVLKTDDQDYFSATDFGKARKQACQKTLR